MFSHKKRFLSGILILTIITFFTIGCSTDLNTQEVNSSQRASGVFKNLNEESFDADNIMSIITELSSEKYKGRLAGTKENELAGQYIAKYFKKIGLENPKGLENYMQYFNQSVLMNNSASKFQIMDRDSNVINEYKFLENYRVHTVAPGICVKGELTEPLMVIEDSNQLNVDNTELSGKVLLIPENIKNQLGYRDLVTVSISRGLDIKGMIWEEDIDSPNHSQNHFTVSPYVHTSYKHDNDDGPMIFRCDSKTYRELCEASKKGHSVNMKADYSVEKVRGANIIGFIPGSDDALNKELIIITAHFDHVGDNKNGTYNPGALDNGSGTAVLMEIARILKENDAKSKRPILFAAFNGEEEGLYGSKFFAYNTILDIDKDKTVVINMDMVGSKAVMPLTIGTDSKQNIQLKDDLYRIAKELNIDAQKSTMSNSDHTPFARRGIDAVCLINEDWTHGYHSPEDTIETVGKDRIEEVLRLVLNYIDKKAY